MIPAGDHVNLFSLYSSSTLSAYDSPVWGQESYQRVLNWTFTSLRLLSSSGSAFIGVRPVCCISPRSLSLTKKPVSVDPVCYLHMCCKYTHPVSWASMPQSLFWQYTHNTQNFWVELMSFEWKRYILLINYWNLFCGSTFTPIDPLNIPYFHFRWVLKTIAVILCRFVT